MHACSARTLGLVALCGHRRILHRLTARPMHVRSTWRVRRASADETHQTKRRGSRQMAQPDHDRLRAGHTPDSFYYAQGDCLPDCAARIRRNVVFLMLETNV
jgi:hypothetical protein